MYLADRLASRGHEVVVFHGPGEERKRDSVPGERYALVPWSSGKGNRVLDGALLLRRLRRFRPHCIIGRRGAVNWALALGALMRVPVRIGWEDTRQDALLMDARTRPTLLKLKIKRRALLYRSCTRIAVVTRASMEHAGQSYGVPAERCLVVGYGVTAPARSDHKTRSKGRTIVCLGRLEPSKGHDLLLRAVASLSSNATVGLRVLLIGDGPMREQLETMVGELGLDEIVRFKGWVSHSDAMRALSAADMLVHPSWIDNAPFAVIEAMSCGIPVVATRVGGVQEMVQHEEEGLLVDRDDVQALTAALTRLLEDSVLRHNLGSNAWKRFERQFEINGWTRRVGDQLEQLLDSTHGDRVDVS